MQRDLQGESALTCGSITIEHLTNEQLVPGRVDGTAVSIRQSRYTWLPPPDVGTQLPSDFTLVIDCITGLDGVRQFKPFGDGGAVVLIAKATKAGMALLFCDNAMSKEQRFSYRVNWLLYKKASGFREHLNRRFNNERDLWISQAGKLAADDKHVLPENLGQDANGDGTPWTPRDLMEWGRAAAIAFGSRNPDPATCIRLGLLSAARLNPIDTTTLPEDQALALVRLALFDFGPSHNKLDETLTSAIEERFLSALERHMNDDTTTFNDWLYKNTDNIVHAISKQKKGCGPLSRETVRQALLEMVFKSFSYVGDCIHYQMTAFARALAVPLSRDELPLFDLLYRRRPYLGGLPLLLLQDRFEFLQEAIIDLISNPSDNKRIGTLLRLLSFYADMVGKRRDADRQSKARSSQRNNQGGIALVHELDLGKDSNPQSITERFQAITEYLRRDRKASCQCHSTEHWNATLTEVDDSTENITVDEACSVCDHNERFTVTRQTFERVGREILKDA